MHDFITSPLFSIALSLLTFQIGVFLYNKTNFPLFNPLLVSQVLLIFFLLGFKIHFEEYDKGGQFISFFLTPATVVLAVPLYKKIKLLKENAVSILLGITVGSFCGIISILIMSKLFHLSKSITFSMIPKSITTPIGVEVCNQLGGISSLTVAAIILTGILGSIIAPFLCKIFKITDSIAKGTSIGTSSHAVGTTKAIEMGETEGAMSGLSIGIAGLVTVFIAPIAVQIWSSFFGL